ncbi:phage minor head protein [Streptomyces triticagri]|uniref:phage minor head protein n=1 Tax=Streptomyces triticagri TaxID=2293568 RepID=UPI00131468DC|nr:phage minor head protein [Streptomyces triticagri]
MTPETASAEQALTHAARQAIGAYVAAIEERALASLTAAGPSYSDRPLWRRLVAQYLAPAFRQAWRTGFAQARRTPPGPEQDTSDTDLDQLATRTLGITDRVADAFRTVIARAENTGALRDRVAQLATLEEWHGQADIMGRTAAATALNAGLMAGALDAEQATGERWEKTWLATSDARTRHTHRAAHGQRRRLNQPFRVGRSRMQFPGDPRAPLSEVMNCRCTILVARAGDPSLTAPPLPDVEAPMNQALAYAPWDALTAAGGVTLDSDGAWSGPISLVNTWSADGRMLALDQAEELRVRPLPLPVAVQYQLAQGHDGAKVGLMSLDEVWREGDQVMGSGRIDTTDPEGAALARKISDGFLRFVSADIDQADTETVCIGSDGTPDTDCDPQDPAMTDGSQVGQIFTGWRIMGATLVAHPAFPDAHVALADTPPPAEPAAEPDEQDEEEEREGCYLLDPDTGRWNRVDCDTEDAVPAAELPEDADIALATTAGVELAVSTSLPWAPKDTAWDGDAAKERLFAWATDGEQLDPAKLRRAFLVEDGGPQERGSWSYPVADVIDGELTLVWAGVVAAKAALGGARGATPPKGAEQAKATVDKLIDAGNKHFDDGDGGGGAEGEALETALTASGAGAGWMPPTEYFRDPQLTELTLWQYDSQTRRVWGHIAGWNVPHVSFQGRQVFAPHSPSAYERFHMRPIPTSEGLVDVGPLCLGTDHAPWSRPGQNSGKRAVNHYESTGSIIAAVRCGEDAHGIWMSGVLLPSVTDEQMLQLQLATLSGDWRNEGGGLDLKAVLAVPAGHEGFYTPKSAATDRSDYALVASGALTPDVLDVARRRTATGQAWTEETGGRGNTVRMARSLARVDQLAARTTNRRLRPRVERAHALAVRSNAHRLGARSRRAQALAARATPADADAEGGEEWANWIEQTGTGHLPRYIREIANALMRSGRTESQAIQIAVGRTKSWCRGGGNVKADTRAKACAAVAEWEAKRAEARAS